MEIRVLSYVVSVSLRVSQLRMVKLFQNVYYFSFNKLQVYSISGEPARCNSIKCN